MSSTSSKVSKDSLVRVTLGVERFYRVGGGNAGGGAHNVGEVGHCPDQPNIFVGGHPGSGEFGEDGAAGGTSTIVVSGCEFFSPLQTPEPLFAAVDRVASFARLSCRRVANQVPSRAAAAVTAVARSVPHQGVPPVTT
ncbi:MAG: hypothetical protein M3Y35_00760 [Actinomycetota bacterium]|nr:hypothetical protein [Actinomycetota bacterium]